MQKSISTPALFLAATLTLTATHTLAAADETVAQDADEAVTQPAAQEGALVMFLTQTDPMLAGHALHFATHMSREGRRATILLVGEAGRLALKDWPTPVSAVGNNNLQQDLIKFIDTGGKVYITPYTLHSFNADPEDLIAGAGLPKDPKSVHGHMFEPDTQLLAW